METAVLNAEVNFAAQAYGSQVVRGARDTEYDIFSRVTRMLRAAEQSHSTQETIAAVSKNSDLWMLLANDLADSKNGLPEDTKAGLLSLASYALRHGQRVMAGKASVGPLFEINMAIMKGLRGGHKNDGIGS